MAHPEGKHSPSFSKLTFLDFIEILEQPEDDSITEMVIPKQTSNVSNLDMTDD